MDTENAEKAGEDAAGWETDLKQENKEEQTNYVEDVFKNMGFNMNLLTQNGLEE